MISLGVCGALVVIPVAEDGLSRLNLLIKYEAEVCGFIDDSVCVCVW